MGILKNGGFKKLACLALAAVTVLGMGAPAQAAPSDDGSITINASTHTDSLGVAGKTFEAYRILSAEMVGETADDGISYKVPDSLKPYFADRYKLEASDPAFHQKVQAAILAEGVKGEEGSEVTDTDVMQALARDLMENELSKDALAELKYGEATGGEKDTSVTISNLPLGYYLVVDKGAATPISALALTTTAKNAEVNVKGSLPTLTKKIKDGEDLKDYVNEAVGDNVDFQVTTKVPDMTGYIKYAFAISDVMSNGLTLNVPEAGGLDAAFTIVMGEGEHAHQLAAGTDYVVEEFESAGGQGYRIVFKDFIQYKGDDANLAGEPSHEGEPITVTYSATVSDKAVIGVEGNPNDAQLIYSNNPQESTDQWPEDPTELPDDVRGETVKSEVRVYVVGLQILKTDEKNQPLVGAQFVLKGEKLNRVERTGYEFKAQADGEYWALKDGSYTKTSPSTKGVDKTLYKSETDKYAKVEVKKYDAVPEKVTAVVESGADGLITFKGLEEGTYVIKELQAPNGYNMLEGDINVSIKWAEPSGDTKDCSWTGKAQLPGQDEADMAFNGEGFSGLFRLPVMNQTGKELPSTGGTGTRMFYLVGGILVVLSAIALVVKRRSIDK